MVKRRVQNRKKLLEKLSKATDADQVSSALLSVCMDRLAEVRRQLEHDFLDAIAADMDLGQRPSFPLPDGTKYYLNTGDKLALVVEFKPQQRTLSFKTTPEVTRHTNVATSYKLALPYVQLIPMFRRESPRERWRYDFHCVTFTTKPVDSPNDMLCHPALPNLNRSAPPDDFEYTPAYSGNVETLKQLETCTGSDFHPEGDTPTEQVRYITDHLWGSEFNCDLSAFFHEVGSREPRLRTLTAWERASQKNPFFILDVAFLPACPLARIFRLIGGKGHSKNTELRRHVDALYDGTWKEILSQNTEITEALRAAFSRELLRWIEKFRENLMPELSVFDEAVQKTIQLAVDKAIERCQI